MNYKGQNMTEIQELERRIELKQQEILLFLQAKTKELAELFNKIDELKK
jgi:hypothetical protein